MRQIEFFDTTLRDGEQTPGVNFSIEEKVTIAKQLEKWGITVIEAGFPAASPDSFEAVRQISKVLTTTAVTGLARCVKSDIDQAILALKDAKHPQLHVFIATSPIHMEYKLKMTPEEVLASIDEHVRYAKQHFAHVEFSPEDATRSDRNFLLQAVQTAVDAGATYINIPDTVGYTVPAEFSQIFQLLISEIKSEHNIIFSAHCHDDLGMAVANSLAAIKAGAGRVEGTVNGIGERAGNAALEEIAVALHIRQDFYQAKSPLALAETVNTSSLVSRLSGIAVPRNKAVVGRNAFAHESGIHQDGVLKNPETYEIITPELVGVRQNSLPLGKLSGRHAFTEKLTELGITYEEVDIPSLFAKFKGLADKKKEITDTDLRALVTDRPVSNVEGLMFDRVMLENTTDSSRVATVSLKNSLGEILTQTAAGSGSVDAIFKAIDAAFEQEIELEHYHVDAITGGIDSQASVHVSIRCKESGAVFNASGVDYDVLIASAIAYTNGNNLVKRERVR